MCKRHKRFVIFLDVDGVLNTTTTVQKTPDGYTGIDDARVEVLQRQLKKLVEQILFCLPTGKK